MNTVSRRSHASPGTSSKPVQEDMLGGGQEPSRRMVPPVYLQFYRKPMSLNKVMLAIAAQHWKHKHTAATQE